ncbi:hypothetical protein [Pedobacter sp. NJ-S-72]
MGKIYYKPITITTVCVNGSERFGATASTYFSMDRNKKFWEVNMSGKTKKKDAEEKLMTFLTSNGKDQIEEVQS